MMWDQLRGWVFIRGVVSGAILGGLFGLPFGFVVGAVIGLFCGVGIGAGLGLLNGSVLAAIVKRLYATRTTVRRRDMMTIYGAAILTNVLPFYIGLVLIGLNGMSDSFTFVQAVNSMAWIALYPSIVAGLAAAYFVRGFLVFADTQWKQLSAGEKQFLSVKYGNERVHN